MSTHTIEVKRGRRWWTVQDTEIPSNSTQPWRVLNERGAVVLSFTPSRKPKSKK